MHCTPTGRMIRSGEDIRDLPLSMRKANLDRLLRGRPDGIFINRFEIGAIGPELFRAERGILAKQEAL